MWLSDHHDLQTIDHRAATPCSESQAGPELKSGNGQLSGAQRYEVGQRLQAVTLCYCAKISGTRLGLAFEGCAVHLN